MPGFCRTLFLRLCAVVFSFSFFVLSSVFAATNPLVMTTEEGQMVQWDLTANELVHLTDSDILEAQGDVHLQRGNEYLKADFARYYVSTKWVYLKGNVYVRIGKDAIQAQEAEFDLSNRTGWLKQGSIFLEGPHAYIKGDHIKKHWGEVYTFSNATLTTCDGDNPAWSIAAEEAIVEVDGYARLNNPRFQVKNAPVAYSPFFVVSTKSNRQTGLLTPEIGQSSSKGFYYNQPFFWATSESSDLTFFEHYMAERGFMQGLRFRTRPSSSSTGWIQADWMHDSKIEKDTDSGRFRGDPYVRKNHDRYWIRGMYDTLLHDPQWRFKADLDFVSDQDYLRDFKTGLTGFNASRNELFSLFNRELQEKNRDRVSAFLLTKDWERATVGLSAQYSQNPHFGHGNAGLSTDKTVQRLPQLDAFWHKGRIFSELPLELSASAQAAYMYRRSGTRGSRYNFHPELTLPLTSRYGSLITTGGLRQTYYATEAPSRSDRERHNAPREKDQNRNLYEFSTAGSTEFNRVFSLSETPLTATMQNAGKSEYTAVRHSIQPRIEFIYRPLEDQEENPFYDKEDRLTPQTDLVYSVTNVLTRKRESVAVTEDKDGNKTPELQTSYQDLMRFRLEQAYDYREATRDNNRDRYARRPFGDIIADLIFYPFGNFYVNTRNNWSPYMDALTRHQSGAGLDFPGYGGISASYDYRRKLDEYTRFRNAENHYIHLNAALSYFEPFTFNLSMRQDVQDSSNSERLYGITYSHQCFQIIGNALIEPREENYRIFIVLFGLGD